VLVCSTWLSEAGGVGKDGTSTTCPGFAFSETFKRAGWAATESATDRAFAEELRAFTTRTELAMAVRGEKAWLSWAREWRWWRRTSLCERVGHCATTPLVFLPLPGDVRVAVHPPALSLAGGVNHGGGATTAHVLLEVIIFCS
jgi:hypothetical protein